VPEQGRLVGRLLEHGACPELELLAQLALPLFRLTQRLSDLKWTFL
jgi:hypothetical protein